MLAFARGDASSRGFMWKIGHIRTSSEVERHAPQPLHIRAAVAISSGRQLSCSSNARCGWPFCAGDCGSLPASRCNNPISAGRKFCVMRIGVTGTILPGFNRPSRIEDVLQLAEDVDQRPILPGQERRAAQAVAVLTADRAAEQPHLFVKLAGQRFQLPGVIGIGHVEKRPDVQLPLRGVTED